MPGLLLEGTGGRRLNAVRSWPVPGLACPRAGLSRGWPVPGLACPGAGLSRGWPVPGAGLSPGLLCRDLAQVDGPAGPLGTAAPPPPCHACTHPLFNLHSMVSSTLITSSCEECGLSQRVLGRGSGTRGVGMRAWRAHGQGPPASQPGFECADSPPQQRPGCGSRCSTCSGLASIKLDHLCRPIPTGLTDRRSTVPRAGIAGLTGQAGRGGASWPATSAPSLAP